ncbi:MAG: hypothetical protein NWP47_05025 [Rickettsiaceae bacterium]|nr:hypothetical protein [Rickettsiaceae bacterium]
MLSVFLLINVITCVNSPIDFALDYTTFAIPARAKYLVCGRPAGSGMN